MKIFKLILIFVMVAFVLLCTGTYFYPVQYDSNCRDGNIYRYKAGIYQMITGVSGKKEYKKIGGLSMFFGIKPIICPEEIEKQHFEAVVKSIDSTNQILDWKLQNNGLWISKKGDWAIKEIIAIGPEGMKQADHYISQMGFNDNEPLKEIIDSATFQKLNTSFYKDKNHVYRYYGMVYGGSFSIFPEADPATFEVLNKCYAKDKSHIYESRQGILDNVDYKTFRTKNTLTGCFAKDRNGYLQWGDRISEENMKEEYVQKAIKELK